MGKSCESNVVLVLGWTIEMYLNGAYAPSIVTGRDGLLCRKNPNCTALNIKMHIEISIAYRYEDIATPRNMFVRAVVQGTQHIHSKGD